MDEKIKKVKTSLLDAMDTLIEGKLNSLSFDKTYIAPITNKTNISSTEFKYEVVIRGNKYYIKSTVSHSVGERVRVKFPNNNPSNIYIEETTNNILDIDTILAKEY